jgi:hypothetical protein
MLVTRTTKKVNQVKTVKPVNYGKKKKKKKIPPGAWMFVCSVCCVLTGRGLCDELITRPEEA